MKIFKKTKEEEKEKLLKEMFAEVGNTMKEDCEIIIKKDCYDSYSTELNGTPLAIAFALVFVEKHFIEHNEGNKHAFNFAKSIVDGGLIQSKRVKAKKERTSD